MPAHALRGTAAPGERSRAASRCLRPLPCLPAQPRWNIEVQDPLVELWCSHPNTRAQQLGLALCTQCCASQWPHPQDTRGRQTEHHGHVLCPVQRVHGGAKIRLCISGEQASYPSCSTSSGAMGTAQQQTGTDPERVTTHTAFLLSPFPKLHSLQANQAQNSSDSRHLEEPTEIPV